MKTFMPIWEKLELLAHNELLISHIEVQREIKQGNDELTKWIQKYRQIFKELDGEQLLCFERVRKKYDGKYWENEINKTGGWGDPWLIALSMTNQSIIVTTENKVKPNRIPTIARQVNVKSLNLLEFFNHIGIE